MEREFELAAFVTPPGRLSAIVETPFGFHVLRRDVLEEVHVAHVLVQWAGSQRSKVTRTRGEAHLRAMEALTRLQDGATIGEIAIAYSDGPTGLRGGDLGFFQRGQLLPEFEAAAFELKPGETSTIVESALGFHILFRIE